MKRELDDAAGNLHKLCCFHYHRRNIIDDQRIDVVKIRYLTTVKYCTRNGNGGLIEEDIAQALRATTQIASCAVLVGKVTFS